MSWIIAGRELSFWELYAGRRAGWWWDRRYLTEAEQDALQGPVPEEVLQAIDAGLEKRVRQEKRDETKGV